MHLYVASAPFSFFLSFLSFLCSSSPSIPTYTYTHTTTNTLLQIFF
jgi:hypothetical protein